MSVKQMGLVWEHEFGHAEQLIMLALADHAHDDGTEIRPSVARLAWKTGYEARQVQRILKHLRDDLKILVLVKEGGGRGNPNVYRFDWTKGVKKSDFRPPKRVTSGQKKGDIAMSPEPSTIEPSVPPTAASASPEAPEKSNGVNSKNWFGFFCDLAKSLDIIIAPEDRKQTAGNFQALVRTENPTEPEMKKVVSKILEARANGYDMSPQKALGKVRGNNVTPIRPALAERDPDTLQAGESCSWRGRTYRRDEGGRLMCGNKRVV